MHKAHTRGTILLQQYMMAVLFNFEVQRDFKIDRARLLPSNFGPDQIICRGANVIAATGSIPGSRGNLQANDWFMWKLISPGRGCVA